MAASGWKAGSLDRVGVGFFMKGLGRKGLAKFLESSIISTPR